MSRIGRRLCIAAAALAVGAPGAGAADWPQWGGTNERNMAAAATGLPATFAIGKAPGGRIDPNGLRNVKWVAGLGTATYGNPTVAGGRVFVGTNDGRWSDPRVRRSGGGVVMCLDERTGRLLWRLLVPRYDPKIHGSGFDDLNTGVCSAPTIDGDRAYLVSNRAEVLCLDVRGQANGNDGPFTDEGRYMAGDGNEPVRLQAGDGDIVWRFDMISRLPSAPHDVTNCNILLHGEHLYVCTGNGVHRMPDEPNPLPEAPSLVVLDKRTGRLLAADGEKIGRRVFHGQWSSPSLGRVGGRDLIFFGGGDGICYAFEALPPGAARGGALTRREHTSGTPTKNAATANANENTPATRPAPPAKLRKVWWYDCNPPEYTVSDGVPIDYWNGDATRATVRKDYKGPSEIIATPVFHKGRVYVAIGRDPVHGKACGVLHCIDASKAGDVTRTGRIWSYKGVSRTMSTVAVAGGLVYIADIAGAVHCLDADTGRPQWVHHTKQEIWASPFVADGKVYVGTQRKWLWVFAAGRKPKLLGKVRLRRAVSTTPIVANGVLYVASNRYLYALKADGG